MSDELLADLRRDEGWRPCAYPDHLGYLTIGYGFLIDPDRSGGIPRPVAEFWLRYAVNEKLGDLRKKWPAFDSQPAEVQRALGNMAYQLGVGRLLQFQKMLDALSVANRSLAAEEALDSTWAKQTPSRAQRVAALIKGA